MYVLSVVIATPSMGVLATTSNQVYSKFETGVIHVFCLNTIITAGKPILTVK